MSIRTPIVTKLSNMAIIWQPRLKIWQPCLFYNFENASIGFHVLENVVLAYKIMVLGQLEAKLWSIEVVYGCEMGLVG